MAAELAGLGPSGLLARRRAGPAPPQRRRHLQRHPGPPEPPTGLVARPLSPGGRRGRVGRARLGGGPAGGPPRSGLRRHLRRPPPGGRRARSPPSSSSATPPSSGPAPGRRRSATAGCSSPQSTWSATPHGQFRAVGDRAQAPSGLGYALVNRSILSRVLPNLHRESGVERLAGFFRSIRAGVAAAAPDGVDEPAGGHPHARPAERDLLRARLSGLLPRLPPGRGPRPGGQQQPGVAALPGGVRPVDVVIRRVDDQWCDPVELRADSLLGVPGLWRWPGGGGSPWSIRWAAGSSRIRR